MKTGIGRVEDSAKAPSMHTLSMTRYRFYVNRSPELRMQDSELRIQNLRLRVLRARRKRILVVQPDLLNSEF
jgi:hypothetical protein